MKGIILAAGRGSRMGLLTDDKPKCMNLLCGKTLLEWQSEALRAAGVDEIYVVTGYKNKLIEKLGYATTYNPNWAHTNMVESLYSAISLIDKPTIVSYSDIVYGSELVRSLISSIDPIAIAYDKDWQWQWQKRFSDPLQDAESFEIRDGKVIDIGQKVSDICTIEGQYIGLIRIEAVGVDWILEVIGGNQELRGELDMTSLLSIMVARGFAIKGVETRKNWFEIDNKNDLELCEALIECGDLIFR